MNTEMSTGYYEKYKEIFREKSSSKFFLKKKKIKSISIVLNTIKIFLESKNKIYQNIEEIII